MEDIMLSLNMQKPASVFHRNPELVPTPKNYGIKAPPVLMQLGTKSGILISTNDGTSVVNGMPLLCQGDPALDAPLMAYLDGVPDSKLPQKMSPDGKPLLDPTGRPVHVTRAELLNGMKGFGCYDTSIVCVIVAALANRASDLGPLSNRTEEFDEITPIQIGNNPPISRALSQLVWQYEKAFEGQHGFSVNGKAVQPLYLHEVAADVGGGITQSCDPYVYGACDGVGGDGGDVTGHNGRTEAFRKWAFGTDFPLSNDQIISWMKNQYVQLIAYNRYKVVPSVDNGGRLSIDFEDKRSLHKVAFSGFQLGRYPLRINDVGNGVQYRVRLSTCLSDMQFGLPPGVNTSDITSVKFNPNFVGKAFLIYEGDDNKPADSVFFVEHIDGLRIDALRRIGIGPRHGGSLIPIEFDPRPHPDPVIRQLEGIRFAG
jgi:hypothetical protein